MLDESSQVEFSLRHKNTKTVYANINKSALIHCCHVRLFVCSKLCNPMFNLFLLLHGLAVHEVGLVRGLSVVCLSRWSICGPSARWYESDIRLLLKTYMGS